MRGRGRGLAEDWDDPEEDYEFITPEKLMADFDADIRRWNRENGRS